MTKDEIKEWVEKELLPLHPNKRTEPLKKKINQLIEAAMKQGGVPGWTVNNMLADLATQHGYR